MRRGGEDVRLEGLRLPRWGLRRELCIVEDGGLEDGALCILRDVEGVWTPLEA